MKIDLTNNEMAAIAVAFDELCNSADWADHVTENQGDAIIVAMKSLLAKFPEGYFEKFEDENK